MKKWPAARVRELVRRLEAFRRTCRVTTLVEEQETSKSPFRLLVACVISLRTKDEVTAESSRRLFAVADTAHALAAIDPDDDRRSHFSGRFLQHQSQTAPDHRGDPARPIRRRGPRRRSGPSRAAGGRSKDRESGARSRFRYPRDLRRHPRPPHFEPARAGADKDTGGDRACPAEDPPAGPVDPDQRSARHVRAEPLPPNLAEVHRLSVGGHLPEGRRHEVTLSDGRSQTCRGGIYAARRFLTERRARHASPLPMASR